MISISEARKIIVESVQRLDTISISINDAVGHVLAAGIESPIDLPVFNNSAMDGYAINVGNQSGSSTYPVNHEIRAGEYPQFDLLPGEAARIFTGAPVPSGTTCVVIQENVERKNGYICFSKDEIIPGRHIRNQGEQIRAGDVALKAGSFLNAASIGFIASLGITEVRVYSRPSVGILLTGDEVVMPGRNLNPGQLYDANASALSAAMIEAGIRPGGIMKAGDDKMQIMNSVKHLLNESDVVLITGGISAGDFDLVRPVLNDIGVHERFYKVDQKPGKPLYYATHMRQCIFALPGNPAAALTCFYQYVLPAIRIMSGHEDPMPEASKAILSGKHTNKSKRGAFLKARVKEGKVEILDGQDSSMLRSFARTNALAFFPPNTTLEAGTEIDIYYLGS